MNELLDIDALLVEAEENDKLTVWIQLIDDNLFPEGFLKIKIKVPPADVRQRLLKKYYSPEIVLPKRKRQSRQQTSMALKTDALGYATELLDYASEWAGFKGDFDKAQLVRLFKRFPAVGQGFADGCVEAFEDLDKKAVERAAQAEKNS